MKQAQIIERLKNDISTKAYRATCCEALNRYGYDERMMDYHANIYNGEAFEAISLLNWITGSTKGDDIYEAAQAEAHEDIEKAEFHLIAILDMAGFNGKDHYESTMKYA